MANPAKVIILGDASDAIKALEKVRTEAGKTETKLQKVGDKMSGVGRGLSLGVTLPIVALGTKMFMLAGEAEELQAKLVSSFDSMGAAAWTSVDALNANAAALQSLTTFDDEAITDFQSVMLTFGNVTGDVFTDATRLGLDMSAKLGTDLQSTAIQLGKALNDPVKGITALTRAGVSFSAEQKEQIKAMSAAGDMAGAQAVIMGELERQFGGTAEAMALTGQGQAKQAMNALSNLGESFGTVLIPVVAKLAGWLTTMAEKFQNLSPGMREAIVIFAAIVAAVGPLLLILGKFATTYAALAPLLAPHSAAILAAMPWVALGVALIALVVIIVKNWDTIVAFLKKVWDWIKNAATAVGKWIADAFMKAVEFVKNLFLNFTPLGLIIKHFDKIKELATGVGQWIKDKFNAVVDFFRAMPQRITSAVSGLWDGLKNAFRNAVNWIIDKWNNFKLQIKLPSLLGGGTIGLDTPNIPRLHSGGVFRAPTAGGEGLAILKDRETVLKPGARAGGGIQLIIEGPIYGFDEFETRVTEAIVKARRRGSL